MSTIIKIEHLHAGYEGKEVLSDINLTVTSDDYLGIIGPNGGGKTTLIRLILGLMKPTSGTIRFFKEEKRKGETRQDKEQKGETNEDKHLKEVKEISMGYLPQYNALDKQFPISVYEVVLSGLSKSKKLFARYTKAQHAIAHSRIHSLKTERFGRGFEIGTDSVVGDNHQILDNAVRGIEKLPRYGKRVAIDINTAIRSRHLSHLVGKHRA